MLEKYKKEKVNFNVYQICFAFLGGLLTINWSLAMLVLNTASLQFHGPNTARLSSVRSAIKLEKVKRLKHWK